MFIGYAPLSFILSILICLGLMYLDKKAAIAGDINVRESAQTLHKKSISRFGGVAIYLSTIFTTFLFGFDWNSNAFLILVLCLPAFLVGFIDDLKFSLDPRLRIILLLPVPILFFYFADIKVTDLDLGYFDDFLEIEFLALIFLCFAIVGMMNAFNLIDGINGQLSSYLVSIIIALKVIENISGAGLPLSDEFRYFTNILLGALAGFFLLNLFGKIFLGDAGAYFLGSIVCFGLIEAQQSNNLSPWAVMLILAYPFTDLIFSVLRRRFITGGDAMQPDAEHLHHVIYKRFETIQFRHDRARHFFTIVFLTIFNFPYIASAVYFSDNTAALISIFIVYVLSYLLIYFSLSPRFLLSNDKK
jgi:UDP-N-acetylmuramyl pentapeptide phosphotransferase/UDP-N-acetylglucosamine-1-phosphate transferase